MPIAFFLSAIAAGTGLIIMIAMWIAMAWQRELRMRQLASMGAITFGALAVYLAFRLGDLFGMTLKGSMPQWAPETYMPTIIEWAIAEDVGRHNALDKVLGAELQRGALPLSERILFVSGRTSFEIVQKAVMAGVPVVAAVSAPSSLAIDLARSAQVTLLGFVRHSGFNIYAHPERIGLVASPSPLIA